MEFGVSSSHLKNGKDSRGDGCMARVRAVHVKFVAAQGEVEAMHEEGEEAIWRGISTSEGNEWRKMTLRVQTARA